MKKESIALVLAGGRGERLGALTSRLPKPAVHYGGKHRMIDFTLSNCVHSGIDTIGILSQYLAMELHDYIRRIDFRGAGPRLAMLPADQRGAGYRGTADAVFQNMDFVDRHNPEHVLILSGDHIYRMDYAKMLAFHKRSGADVTIAATAVPWREVPRFGILSADEDGRIHSFVEKPRVSRSNLASMGVYIMKADELRRCLAADHGDRLSQHDFGRNIIPWMLDSGKKLYAYAFHGYWRDVGTVETLWQSQMELISTPRALDLADRNWEIFAAGPRAAPSRLAEDSAIVSSRIAGNCTIGGTVIHSLVSPSVFIGPGAEVWNSVLLPGAHVGAGAKLNSVVVGERARIMDGAVIGHEEGSDAFVDDRICTGGVSLVGPAAVIGEGMRYCAHSHLHTMQRVEPTSTMKRTMVG